MYLWACDKMKYQYSSQVNDTHFSLSILLRDQIVFAFMKEQPVYRNISTLKARVLGPTNILQGLIDVVVLYHIIEENMSICSFLWYKIFTHFILRSN